ncbi:uncharacterized protein LOC125074537 [Vanessa atalanta]|uniref:uncharacterized protein LOC125074537 n=1 Tax=Vanessa atalanta TaxID=42275 RepID=UPI001FCDF281|nr:uncharacterized protein LOC125074537 [Vanessa atalanta]
MALHFYKRGPKVYRMLQKIFVLPSPFTLNKMVSKANIKSGLNENIFQQLKKQASRMKPSHKLCTLVFDEMALTPHLDYSRRNDKITGLASMIKKNIRKLNEVGFKVLATVCDQGTSNVSAINYLIKETKQEYAKAGKEAKDGVFEVDNEEVVPLFDVPHLIKGIRNNLLYKDLSYTIDGIKKQQSGTTLQSTMFTDQGLLPSECKDTADILLFFDELFDSMNGSCSNSSKRSGKPLLLPVKPRSEHHEIWKKSKVVLKSMKE